MGVGRVILARMAFNVAVEGVVGIIPVAGDVFDAAWKANQKNVRLLNAWAERPHQTRRSSRLFLVTLAAALIAFFGACAILTYLLLRWLLGYHAPDDRLAASARIGPRAHCTPHTGAIRPRGDI